MAAPSPVAAATIAAEVAAITAALAAVTEGRPCSVRCPFRDDIILSKYYISHDIEADKYTTFFTSGDFCNNAQFLLLGNAPVLTVASWMIVVAFVSLATLYLLSLVWERGGRWFGGVTFTGGTCIIVIMSSHYNQAIFTDWYHHPIANAFEMFPIVGAMNVAIFSFFFSGFQYSIRPGYEAASAVALAVSAFPLWVEVVNSYTSNGFGSIYNNSITYDLGLVRGRIAAERIDAMLMASLAFLWVLHSAMYRTIGHRAAWICAWRQQREQEPAQRIQKTMSSLWMLAAAQGHPTWRTTVGQGTGILLLVLAWQIVSYVQNYLSHICITDNLDLLLVMLWVPPSLLTIAVFWTQFHLLRFGSGEISEEPGREWDVVSASIGSH